MLRVQKEQENQIIKLYILSLTTAIARLSTAALSLAIINKLGKLLPSIASILNILLLGVLNKEILKVFQGTFLPNNLSYLQVYQLQSKPQNNILIINSILSIRLKEGTVKDYPLVKVQVKGFLNYIIILIIIYKNLLVDLIPNIITFYNQVIQLSTIY